MRKLDENIFKLMLDNYSDSIKNSYWQDFIRTNDTRKSFIDKESIINKATVCIKGSELIYKFIYNNTSICNKIYENIFGNNINFRLNEHLKVYFRSRKYQVDWNSDENSENCFYILEENIIIIGIVINDIVFITFRGTKSLCDWKYNLSIKKKRASSLTAYHQNYFKLYNKLKKSLEENIAKISPQNSNNLKIIFTGHSLGGALAQVFADHFTMNNMNNKNMCISIGNPRVIESLTKRYNIISIYNFFDIVPFLPLNFQTDYNQLQYYLYPNWLCRNSYSSNYLDAINDVRLDDYNQFHINLKSGEKLDYYKEKKKRYKKFYKYHSIKTYGKNISQVKYICSDENCDGKECVVRNRLKVLFK